MDIYGEIILDHFKNPRQAGLLDDAQITGEDFNPLCGDKVRLSVKLDDQGYIKGFGFSGDGCAISVASTSLLGEKILGEKLNDIVNMNSDEVLEMLEIPISPGRIKCALLGFSCLKKAATIYHAEHE